MTVRNNAKLKSIGVLARRPRIRNGTNGMMAGRGFESKAAGIGMNLPLTLTSPDVSLFEIPGMQKVKIKKKH